ncbi:hypothetical protein LP422_07930 [Janibacter limosus]|uniref:Uncharacterized protein n=1 Tax=Janibacter limosus TaxID=53458 RepID=A0AC61U7K7_9MICO|nr:hypothetical protein [Janibacter limosus]UUZ45837.1 hypothetical protein LP422_07930 [Janibacter limosus]
MIELGDEQVRPVAEGEGQTLLAAQERCAQAAGVVDPDRDVGVGVGRHPERRDGPGDLRVEVASGEHRRERRQEEQQDTDLGQVGQARDESGHGDAGPGTEEETSSRRHRDLLISQPGPGCGARAR